MMKKILNLKNTAKKGDTSRSGFVLLFTVMLSSIILAIALGVSNIAFREQKFSTSGKDTNDAFFAADIGVECALFYDKTTLNRFVFPDSRSQMSCAGLNFTPGSSGGAASWSYNFTLTGLSSSGRSCAKVTIDKVNVPPVATLITSEGLSTHDGSCGPLNANSVERELQVTY